MFSIVVIFIFTFIWDSCLKSAHSQGVPALDMNITMRGFLNHQLQCIGSFPLCGFHSEYKAATHVSVAGKALLTLLGNVLILGSCDGSMQPKWVSYAVTDYRWLAWHARQCSFTKSSESYQKTLSTQKNPLFSWKKHTFWPFNTTVVNQRTVAATSLKSDKPIKANDNKVLI